MKTNNWLEKCEYPVLIFYSFLCTAYCLSAAVPKYNCSGVCAGLEDSNENNGSDSSDSDYASSADIDLFNPPFNASLNLRFVTPCETPNHEISYCMNLSKCPVLNAVNGKRKYVDFLEASRCGSGNENQEDFRVCCGKYNGFRNVSKAIDDRSAKTILEDLSVLPKKCGTQRHIMRGRIVGGIEAALGEYPWMARIIHKNNYGYKSYGCAGFLIHTKYVVTAAHCIRSEFSDIRGEPYSVLLGEHNVTTKIDCSPGGTFCADPVQISRIDKIVVHENYSRTSKNHHYDIALIHLRKAIKTSEFVQPICLLSEDNPNITKYYISGWGKTENSEFSPVKLKIDLFRFDKDQCKEKFQILSLEIDDESQTCAGGEKMKDSCNGDSGGPLMTTNGTHYFAAGLVSYGIGCGMQGWPGIYTSVPYYVDWIKKNMVEISTRSPKVKKNRKKNKKKSAQVQPSVEGRVAT